MRTLSVIGTLVACFVGASTCAVAGSPHDRLVKEIPLQTFFHTPQQWQASIYQSAERDAEFADRPVRVCFTRPGLNKPSSECRALFGGAARPDGSTFPLQTLDSAELAMLPSPAGGPDRPSLIIRATFAGGGAGELKGLYVWTDTSGDHQGRFVQTFKSVVTQAGEQEFLKKGPLAGAFVSLDQVYEGNEANMEVPVHYGMHIYEPAALGYVEVLGMLSEKRYPSNHTGDGLTDAIAALTPEMSRALKRAYPQGIAQLER